MPTLTLSPDGVGDYTNIVWQEPVSGEHWDKVDDPPASPDTTTYLSAYDVQKKDAYTLQDTSQTGTINSVKVYFRIKGRYADETVYLQPFLRLNAVETAGTEQSQYGGAFTTYNEILARPGGGNWSWADINSLQVAIGLKSDSIDHQGECTQVYVEVDYTWSGKVSGVTDPAKVMGIARASIAKVKGVG